MSDDFAYQELVDDEKVFEHVGVSMTKEKMKEWEAIRGTVAVPLDNRNHHRHPLLAAYRNVGTAIAAQMCAETGAKVVEVGAAPHRTFEYLREAIYLMPNLHVGDDQRMRMAPKASLKYVVREKLEEFVPPKEEHIYLMVNSAYYIHPIDLWNKLSAHDCLGAIVLGHDFTGDVRGGFWDEATWVRRGSVITMQVTGNGTPYVHEQLPWTYGWVGAGGETFHAKRVEGFGERTAIWRVTAGSGATPLGPLSLRDVIAKPESYGPIMAPSNSKALFNNSVVGEYHVEIDRLFLLGGYIFQMPAGGTDTINVHIPVSAVAAAAERCVNMPRDAALLETVTRVVREHVKNSRGIHPDERARVISTAAALGFVTNLQYEVELAQTMQVRFDPWIKLGESVFAFERPKVMSCYIILFVVLGLLSTMASVDLVDHNGRDRTVVTTVVLAVVVCVVLTFYSCVKLSRYINRRRLGNWSASIQADEPQSMVMPSGVPIDSESARIDASRRCKPPRTDGQHFEIVREEEVQKPRKLLFASGLVFPDVMTSVFDETQEVEMSAVSHRVLQPKKKLNWGYLHALRKRLEDHWLWQIKGTVNKSYDAFVEFLAHLKNRGYSAEYVQNLKECYWESEDSKPKRHKTKAFVKREKNSKPLYTWGQEEIKPRMIQPPSDALKANGGLWTTQLYKFVQNTWKGSPIVYGSGMTTDAIGRRVDEYLAGRTSEIVALVGDYSAYDTCLDIFKQDVVFDVYRRCGLSDDEIRWLASVSSAGTMPKGVKYNPKMSFTVYVGSAAYNLIKLMCLYYEIEHTEEDFGDGRVLITMGDVQMCSGRPDTNLTDTLFNAAIAMVALGEDITKCLVLVCGDDCTILCPADLADPMKDSMEDWANGLGMDLVMFKATRRCDWEFCSKLFWYAREGGQDITVLGPKLGRLLHRAGWTVVEPRIVNVASFAQGMKRDASHIPFLRQYANKLGELCAKQRIRLSKGGARWEGLVASKSFQESPLNWDIIAERYGSGDGDFREFLKAISEADTLPATVNFRPLERWTEIDS